MHFTATIQLDGKTATGIEVPEEVIAELGGGNRPRVRVTFAGYRYQTTVARMRGAFKFPVSAAVREQTGVSAGDRIEVEIELDTSPRELAVPAVLAEALDGAGCRAAFDALSFTNRKRHVLAVESAKTDETRQRRLQRIVSELGERPVS